jgi:FeS assembly SUF system regulator
MIRLTKQSDYGIVLMTQFARAGKGGFFSVTDLALRSGLSAPMVNKTVKLLLKARLLVSSRGVNGGYQIARDAGAITLEEIIEAVDGPIALTECHEAGGVAACGILESCPTRINWGVINQAVRDGLAGITLLQMIHPFFSTTGFRHAVRETARA